MAIKPILFNNEMVRTILDGRKTCTRRIVKDGIPDDAMWGYTAFTPKGYITCRGVYADGYGEGFYKLPYKPGDIMYVRETWCKGYEDGTYIYRADDKLADLPTFKESSRMIYNPPINMPKEAARIWLKVTDVRVERLQDITEAQAEKEGFIPQGLFAESEITLPAAHWFSKFWNFTIKKSDLDRYGWAANPWVWVIEFERCEKPEEAEHERK